MNRYRLLLVFCSTCVFCSVHAQEEAKLVVATWKGSSEASQDRAYIQMFEVNTGVEVVRKPYFGGVEPLIKVEEGEHWDVLDMYKADAIEACEKGLLHKFDHNVLAPAPDNTPPTEDFFEDSLLECGVEHFVYSTVIAYEDGAFADRKPSSVKDFFDTENFPGKRAIRKEPVTILEWALYSYNIPLIQINNLLSIDRGMRLAFKKLDKIRSDIVWVEPGEESLKLLNFGDVVMASMPYEQYFDIRLNSNLPISYISDGQFLDSRVWVISSKSTNIDLAVQFIKSVTTTESMVNLAHLMPYSPTRYSAYERVGFHESTKFNMLDHLPTSERNLATSIWSQPRWYLNTEYLRERRFSEWLETFPN